MRQGWFLERALGTVGFLSESWGRLETIGLYFILFYFACCSNKCGCCCVCAHRAQRNAERKRLLEERRKSEQTVPSKLNLLTPEQANLTTPDPTMIEVEPWQVSLNQSDESEPTAPHSLLPKLPPSAAGANVALDRDDYDAWDDEDGWEPLADVPQIQNSPPPSSVPKSPSASRPVKKMGLNLVANRGTALLESNKTPSTQPQLMAKLSLAAEPPPEPEQNVVDFFSDMVPTHVPAIFKLPESSPGASPVLTTSAPEAPAISTRLALIDDVEAEAGAWEDEDEPEV